MDNELRQRKYDDDSILTAIIVVNIISAILVVGAVLAINYFL